MFKLRSITALQPFGLSADQEYWIIRVFSDGGTLMVTFFNDREEWIDIQLDNFEPI